MTYKLPILPKSDADFTPELARKIITKYQELVAIWKERHDLVLQRHMECCGQDNDACYQLGYDRGFNDALHGYEPAKFGEPHGNK